MTEEETRAAERLALMQRAGELIRIVETKHDIEIGRSLRAIIVDINAHVAIAEDAASRKVDAGDKANARLLNEKEALEVENAALRDGHPKDADPIAMFAELDSLAQGLARNMKRAKAAEGGLFCGGCGANIADNAQGIEPLQRELKELRAFVSEAASLVVEEGYTVPRDEVLKRLELTHGMTRCHGCEMVVESTKPYDWSNLCPPCWNKAVAEDDPAPTETDSATCHECKAMLNANDQCSANPAHIPF